MTRSLGFGTVALAAGLLALAGCAGGGDGWQDRPGPKVLAFFPPLYSLAAQVAGDDAQVQSLLTAKGPHDYEFQPTDARKLRRADLFLINGLGLDDDVGKRLAATAGNPKLKTVEVGESVPEADLLAAGGHEHAEHGHDHGDKHEHGAHDPHVWLGIPEAVHMVGAIRDALTEADPAHKDGYAKRADALTGRLLQLQAEGRDMLRNKSEKARLLTQHDAMRYFARSFGAEVVGVIDLPGQEPSGQRLRELVKLCRDHEVKLIAVEPQYQANQAGPVILTELHAKGVAGAAFVVLDPMETADPAALTPDFYERTMRANLDNLAGALK
ncbi:MAG TPA: metal ABC transporter substrate-binding protein [Gemmataceae bacterium]|jgi:zinc transport system substrate-binding protein